jgi:lipopolysaccharide transport system ATP-binding protein
LKPFKNKVSDPAIEEFWALKDVSFEIKQGDRVGIIGRNGAGKSTLLKILSRITEPTKGSIRINGRVASLLEVGTGFHPELTGRENIYLNGAILGMSKIEIKKKFDEIVAFAEVERFLDTPVKRYSSGMYVRLAFAVAAHLEPEILVVDEVLAVGDSAFQKKCLGKMDDVAKQGRTVFFVSHNMASIRSLCKVGYWFEKGSLRESGLVDEIVDIYEKETLYKASSQSSSKFVNHEQGIEVHGVHACLTNDGVITLRIEIEGCALKPIYSLGISIQLTTSEGVLVSNIWPSMAKSFLENVQGSWKCAFEYPDITRYLASGDYVIHVSLNKPKMAAMLKVENAALIHIPPIDVYDAGTYFYLRQHGIVPLPVKFFS